MPDLTDGSPAREFGSPEIEQGIAVTVASAQPVRLRHV